MLRTVSPKALQMSLDNVVFHKTTGSEMAGPCFCVVSKKLDASTARNFSWEV